VEAYIPDVAQLAGIYASLKKNKAGGEDPTPANLARQFPVQFAENLRPIVVSSMLDCKEPLFWAGGVAHELLKGFQSGNKASQYRFVLLEDTGGKVYHKYLRQCITTYIDTYILCTMCGVFLRRGTDFAGLFLKTLFEASRAMKESYGALFLDVSAAFESLQHWFVFGSRPSDTAIASVFARLGFGQDIFQEFRAESLAPAAFCRAGVPSVLNKLIASAHRVSWFSTGGLQNVAVATQGSKAGDPLGDIVFAFLIARVLHNIKNKLNAEGIGNNFNVNTQNGLFGPACICNVLYNCVNYADDNVFLYKNESPTVVVETLQKLTKIALEEFAFHGLKCSIGPEKAAIMTSLVGKSRNSARALFECDHKTVHLRCPNRANPMALVPVVKEYKHVGYYVTTQMVNNRDVYFRIGKAKDAMSQLGSKVLGNAKAQCTSREKIALIPIAKMLANASLWCNLSTHAISALDTAYNNVYRTVGFPGVWAPAF